MSDSANLERRYRQLLAGYPRAFRREDEQEILALEVFDEADPDSPHTTPRSACTCPTTKARTRRGNQ